MKAMVLILLFALSISADSIPHILKGYESSDNLVIVIPDGDEDMRVLAMDLARKISKVYPEDYVQEENYVDRFKLNYYANYAVIMLGELKKFKLMSDYKFFLGDLSNKDFFSVDYGLIEKDFSFVYTGDNPYSIAKDLLAKKNGEVASPPFILLSGDSIAAVEGAAKIFFEKNILSALVPNEGYIDQQFSRLKANQFVAQVPQVQSIPGKISIPNGFRFVA